MVEQRPNVSESLPRAGLGNPDQVSSGEDARQDLIISRWPMQGYLALDGGRFLKAVLSDESQEVLVKAEVRKGHDRLRDVYSRDVNFEFFSVCLNS